MADVFLSYKSEDRDLVQALAQALESEGVSVWLDNKIAPGEVWRETIARALGEAKVVIVAWSKRTENPSDAAWVLNEVDEAQRLHLPIIPVRLEDCSIPLGHRHVQAANLTGWRGDRNDPEWRKVLGSVRTAITGLPDAATSQSSMPDPPLQVVRHATVLRMVLLLLGVGIIGIGSFYIWHSFGPTSSERSVADNDEVSRATAGEVDQQPDVRIVHFDAGAEELGQIRNEGGGVWGEYNKAGDRTYGFRQVGGDAMSVELYDETRDVSLVLDFRAARVLFRMGRDPYREIYRISAVER